MTNSNHMYCSHKPRQVDKFDLDNSYCLYCGEFLKLSVNDDYSYYNCICGELFTIVNYMSENNFDFFFSCKEFTIADYFDELDLFLKNKNGVGEIKIDIDFDFSNKEKMYNKLKSYILFS